jgi:dihydroorotase
MLNHVHNGKLSLKKLVDLFSINPAKLFDMPELGEIKIRRRADLSIVDLKRKEKIT